MTSYYIAPLAMLLWLRENQASQEFQVHQVHLEWLACQVHRDLKGNLLMDHQELKE